MKAEIIAVGSELLTPDSSDTNSLYLTQKLNEAGCDVQLKTIVGDVREDIEEILRQALRRSDLILFSGGLGPTMDDLTRSAVAGALDRPLIKDPGLLEELRRKFASRGFIMSPNNERQAEVILGADILENRMGTAPGMWIEEKDRIVILLPGPPRELQSVFENHALPRILKKSGETRLETRSFFITGMTESELDAQLAPIYTAYPRVRTTILAGTRHISVRLYCWTQQGSGRRDLDELASRFQEKIGPAIFSTQDEPMEEVVGRMLRESRNTLAIAESCTAGMLGMHVTRVPGSSDYFMGGIECYSDAAKIDLCGVPPGLIRQHGAVSAQVAEALAAGVREKLRASIGLSITGIAGPGGGSPEKPVGLVYIGLADGSGTLNRHRIMPGDRESVRERSTYLALSWLRRFLMKNMG
ncbi:MAG: competence/damage-inducible protein A [Acidobacteria bacterium]|nr:competence/damage-inducible protein A [Acidobacteriota bacterium]